ncbi:MAG: hypothetical protein E5Y58_32105, partial [Mesorhizobium sp.]
HVYSRVAIATGPLQRKLQEPKFRAPTWTDYLCLNRRLTTVDQQLDERILQLHAGELPPQDGPSSLRSRKHLIQ